MDIYFKKMKDICNLMGKIKKKEKILANIQVAFCFVMLYVVRFKNIFILKVSVLVTMIIISITSFILTLKARKLMNELLETLGISRKS